MKIHFILFSTFLAITSLIYAQDIQTKVDEFPKEAMQTQNKEIARLVAKEISTSLPQVVDQYTQLTAITTKDATLIYTFEIDIGLKSDQSVMNEDKTRMKAAVTKGVCQSSHKFLEAGINTSYKYINAKSKVPLFEFHITQQSCPQFSR